MARFPLISGKEAGSSSARNPLIASITVEGISRDHCAVELTLTRSGIKPQKAFLSLPVALELSRQIREEVRNYLGDPEIIEEAEDKGAS